MKAITNTMFTGRKAKTGNLCFDETGRMQVFVAYCPRCHAKVAMDLREAEQLANKYARNKNRPINRLLLNKFEQQ